MIFDVIGALCLDQEELHKILCWKNHFFGTILTFLMFFLFHFSPTVSHSSFSPAHFLFFRQLGDRGARIGVTFDLFFIQQIAPPLHRIHEESLTYGANRAESGGEREWAESGCFQLRALKHLAISTGLCVIFSEVPKKEKKKKRSDVCLRRNGEIVSFGWRLSPSRHLPSPASPSVGLLFCDLFSEVNFSARNGILRIRTTPEFEVDEIFGSVTPGWDTH